MKRSVRFLLKLGLAVLFAVLWLWTLGAAYYAFGAARGSGALAALGFVVATAVFLVFLRRHSPWWILGSFGLGAAWFVALEPSVDRDWLIEVARMPTVRIDGDTATIGNIRKFRYRSPDDFDVAYDDRTYDLTKLVSVDLLMCYWDGNTRIAHTMLSFGFEGEDYLCLSVEVRREKGEGWGGLPGIYKQFEIIYILGDERDLINLRTSHRGEDLYLFRLQLPPDEIRQYFEHVLRKVETLNREPEFYDTLDYNCSSSLTRMGAELWPDRPRARGLASLLNGGADRDAYLRGAISNELPFDELKRRSYITPVGKRRRDAPDFSRKIREALPGSHLSNFQERRR